MTHRANRGKLYALADKDRLLLHIHLMNPPDGMEVDHIDGDGLNNRRVNLRIVTHRQNIWNRKKNVNPTSSKFKGVSLYKKSGRWVAYIAAHGKRRHIGYFDDEEAAARAYDAEARRLHGEFACLNFPGESATTTDTPVLP